MEKQAKKTALLTRGTSSISQKPATSSARDGHDPVLAGRCQGNLPGTGQPFEQQYSHTAALPANDSSQPNASVYPMPFPRHYTGRKSPTRLILSLVLVLTGFVTACTKDDVSPTGSLKITYLSGSTLSNSPSYTLSTEVLYSSGQTLKSGTLFSISTNQYQTTIDDLNPGTYVFRVFGAGAYTSVVQVTAGRQREYTLK